MFVVVCLLLEHQSVTCIRRYVRSYSCYKKDLLTEIVCSLNINSSVLHFTSLFFSTNYVRSYGLWTVAICIILNRIIK